MRYPIRWDVRVANTRDGVPKWKMFYASIDVYALARRTHLYLNSRLNTVPRGSVSRITASLDCPRSRGSGTRYSAPLHMHYQMQLGTPSFG